MSHAFINYRRSDSAQASRAIHSQLRERFGASSVFLDVNAILPGAQWPNRLSQSLIDSKLLLVVMGPRWLSAADQYGKRRIDVPDDWVRREIELALELNKPIIPILVAGLASPIPPEGLPDSIRKLSDIQALVLRDEKWDHDFSELTQLLCSKYGFVENQIAVDLPSPEVNIEPISSSDLNSILVRLPGWQAIESTALKRYPSTQHELRRTYTFRSFSHALQFMVAAAPIFERHSHHPRWENQWKSVTVYLTTWDIGGRISALDVNVATDLEHYYDNY